jgi:hypothetical protein
VPWRTVVVVREGRLWPFVYWGCAEAVHGAQQRPFPFLDEAVREQRQVVAVHHIVQEVVLELRHKHRPTFRKGWASHRKHKVDLHDPSGTNTAQKEMTTSDLGTVHTKTLDWILNWMRLDAVDPRFPQIWMMLDELGWFDFDFGGSNIQITSGNERYNQLECRKNMTKTD